MLGAVAQFERDLIIERTKAGLAMARKNGRRQGPPIKWQPDMVKQARKISPMCLQRHPQVNSRG